VAERQINTYLMAASTTATSCPKRLRLLVLPITDAPHHSLLPDLGHAIHLTLTKSGGPLPGSLATVLEQCIPCLRCAPRPVPYTDSQDVFLNLTLALLLGLYPGGAIKRPSFGLRADVYGRIHSLLTSSREQQTLFCLAHPHVVLLACMEYVARVIPAYIPSLSCFLAAKDPSTPVFFRRVAILCDELRQGLDSATDVVYPSWQQVQALCACTAERIARLKKNGVHTPCKEPPIDPALLRDTTGGIRAHWSAPRLIGPPSLEECRLLGQSLGLQGKLLYHIQRDVQVSLSLCPLVPASCGAALTRPRQVYPLPGNLRRMQERQLAKACVGNARSTFLKTRHFMCMHCILTQKSALKPRLRLDTLRQTLICSTCSSEGLLSVNMIGQILRHRRQFFYLCPGCVSIQAYEESEGGPLWTEDGSSCPHRDHAQTSCPPPRHRCDACSETAGPHTIQRIDHLTGETRDFHFCQRHLPRTEQLLKCVNARQLGRYCA
jgi:hypothetical protein